MSYDGVPLAYINRFIDAYFVAVAFEEIFILRNIIFRIFFWNISVRNISES